MNQWDHSVIGLAWLMDKIAPYGYGSKIGNYPKWNVSGNMAQNLRSPLVVSFDPYAYSVMHREFSQAKPIITTEIFHQTAELLYDLFARALDGHSYLGPPGGSNSMYCFACFVDLETGLKAQAGEL